MMNKILPRSIQGVSRLKVGKTTLYTKSNKASLIFLNDLEAKILHLCAEPLTWSDALTALQISEDELKEVLSKLQSLGLTEPSTMPARIDSENIVESKIEDETVLYNLSTDKVIRLNATATQVWHSCDGQSAISSVVEKLNKEHGIAKDACEELVWMTISQLNQEFLLASNDAPKSLSRREFVSRFGTIAAALPFVGSILAPTPAAAQSYNCTNCVDARNQGVSGVGNCATCVFPGGALLGGRFRFCIPCDDGSNPNCADQNLTFCTTSYTVVNGQSNSCESDTPTKSSVCTETPHCCRRMGEYTQVQQNCAIARTNAVSQRYACCEC